MVRRLQYTAFPVKTLEQGRQAGIKARRLLVLVMLFAGTLDALRLLPARAHERATWQNSKLAKAARPAAAVLRVFGSGGNAGPFCLR